MQKALNLPNKYTSLDFKNILASDLKVKLNNYYNFQISEPSDYKKQVESLTEAFRFNLQALSYIALLVSFYLIFQTIFISFQRKSKEIGILKTLGFSQKQIFTVLMVEAGLLGLIGSLIGCLLGIWLSGLILATLQKTVNELYFSVESIKLILSWQGILSGFILGLATCILGGFPAAVGAVFGISPQINLQSSQFKNFKQIPVSYLKTIYLSGSLILLLLLLVQNFLFKIPNKYLGFIMAFIVLIGFSLISGLFLEIIKSTISKIQNWFGQLFSIRLSANFIRLWIATGALICGLSMTLSINFMIDTGFNDHLTLPPQAVSAMNLPLYSTTLARLADGRETLLSIHLATIVWDNREKVVPILASGFKPLLGTALMAGYHLEIDFEENGLVSLEQIPPLIS